MHRTTSQLENWIKTLNSFTKSGLFVYTITKYGFSNCSRKLKKSPTCPLKNFPTGPYKNSLRVPDNFPAKFPLILHLCSRKSQTTHQFIANLPPVPVYHMFSLTLGDLDKTAILSPVLPTDS